MVSDCDHLPQAFHRPSGEVMKKAALTHNETDRLAALERYGILDTPSDAVLDGITQATADLCETPIALISLIDSTRQWFKSCIGMSVRETSRDLAFCAHAILEPTALMEVEDTFLDARFADSPLVTGDPKIRFYAGKPLITSDGYVLGTLCVIDDKPRRLTDAQRDGLSRLAQVVIDLLEERHGSRIGAIDQAVEETARHGVLITDPNQPDNPITYVNRAIEKLTGYSSAELIGKNCRFLQGPDTDTNAISNLRLAIAASEPCTEVIKNYRKDGTAFWNELTVSPIKDKSGNTINYVGVQNDITDLLFAREHSTRLADVTAEADLARASRNRLAQIVEDSANEIYVSNADTYKILDVNRAARENLGYTLEESLQLWPWDFVEGLSAENMEALVAPLRDGTLDAQVLETVHRRKDGSTYPVSTHLQFMASQSPPVYTAIVQDISDRVRQEEMIKLRDRAIEALDVGVSITDATSDNFPLVYVNQALCDMTGYSPDEVLGQGVLMLQMDDQHQPEHQKLRQAQAKGEPVHVTLKSTRKDGSHYMDELSLSPVHNEAGELTHYIGINRDVTEKLETEARLRQAQKIDAIGQLSGGIAHDFNNLLSVITGNLEFLTLTITDKAQRNCIDEADKAAQMGARLTRRLLTFAKQGQLEPVVLDANEHVLSAIELLSSTIGETINLRSHLSPDLWRIHADSSEIENTVVNLVLNARDAMPDGGNIKVETKNVSFGKDDIHDDPGISPGDYIRLSVTDNGSGMTDEVIDRIFEPFFTTKGPGKGTGLGLASIHGFINQSGGYVRVFSELTHGTTIVLYLPRYSEDRTHQEVIHANRLKPTNTDARILVVEDNDMVRNITVKRLRALGFITEQVCNGKEAINFLSRDQDIELILSDVVMAGGLSGFDVAKWVKSNLPRCHILLASGYNEPDTEDSEYQGTEITILKKPYSIAELQNAINATLKQNLQVN